MADSLLEGLVFFFLSFSLSASRRHPGRVQGAAVEALHLGRVLHEREAHHRGGVHRTLPPDQKPAVVRRVHQGRALRRDKLTDRETG